MARLRSNWEKELASIDKTLLDLLNRRASLFQAHSGDPGVSKRLGKSQDLIEHRAGPFPKAAAKRVFREIGRGMGELTLGETVAFLGPEATFTHVAALVHFGEKAQTVPCESIDEVFHQVEEGLTGYGVVPIENTMEGIVHHTLDMLLESSLLIVGEVQIPIDHHLLSRAGSLGEIREVFSHPQALAQCRDWLGEHLPGVTLKEVASTAAAARRARRTKRGAAVASQWAAKRYGLPILAHKIDKMGQNITRFLLLGRKGAPPSAHDKTSIVFSVRDEVGALHGMLAPFARHSINLTRIESRPSRQKPWEYHFFIDLEGYSGDPPIRKALAELERSCQFLKHLGSYPRAKLG